MIGRKDTGVISRGEPSPGEFDEFISRLDAIGKDNNLLYRAVPMSGDLGILYQPNLDKAAFCRAVFDLLHGPDAGHLRLTRYTDFVKATGLPNKWTFPTYFLFICHPESEMFIKPRTTRWFVDFAAGWKSFASAPTPPSYVTVKQLAGQLLTDLREFGPRDMVDIQSFIWVCAYVTRQGESDDDAENADGSPEPFASVFEDKSEAESGTQRKGARFARWMGPILDALRSLGGAAAAKAVLQRIQETTPVPDASLEILASGQTRFYNEVHWARQELVWEGLVDCPERGKWTLTARGQNTNLDEREAQKIVQKWAERHRQEAEMEAEQPPFFTAKTFELLAGLHETPTKDFYAAHRSEFIEALEKPLGNLFEQIRAKLPPQVLDLMETENKILARIEKNDYGRGGAWDYYWGAFYPKGGKRVTDPQLWIWVNHERLEAGFYIGDHGEEQRARFAKNVQRLQDVLATLLQDGFSVVGLNYGYRTLEEKPAESRAAKSFTEWVNRLDELKPSVRVVWPKDEALKIAPAVLVDRITQLFATLFPLVLLAVEEDPMPAIRAYLKVATVAPAVAAPQPPPRIQPEYLLATCAAETGFDVPTLESWVRAVKRKGQAIIYGPPGTGKTFMAEKLAAHLIGGGDGFSELVQFHPAYAYEDFMQGLRPQTNESGGLHYPLVQGRFLQFCNEAATRTGICVLVIDEINRANLARVFGELMFLLEYRKRDIPLAGGGKFKIPDNVRLIGTMNTADRSIALVDHALRRRFAFIALYPRHEVLREFHAKQDTGFATAGLIEQLKKVNEAIDDRHYHIGVSFFLRPDLAAQLGDIWQMEIEPYLEEFFFDQPEKLAQFRWDKVKANVLL